MTMTREEALKALEMMAESGEALPFGDARGSPKELREIIAALSSPCALEGVIRIVRLHFDRHVEGHFFFNDYICLPKEAAPAGVNRLTTLAYIVEETATE